MKAYTINGSNVPLVEEILLDENKKFKIVSYDELKHLAQEDISAFCVKHGFYNIPTLELIDYLKRQIKNKEDKTIEIGAGNGIMAKMLNIVATDSYMQDNEEVREVYENAGQTPVKYGEHVVKLDALEAVKTYKPNIVIASWVTHKYNASQHEREGNMYGVDEEKILKKVKRYIFIGNENSHHKKPINKYDHRIFKAEWLVSRSLYKDKNFIYTWEGVK